MTTKGQGNKYAEKDNLQISRVLKHTHNSADNPMCRNNLRLSNKAIFKKGRHSHPRNFTKGAFGNMSRYNKRLKAQANN